MTKNKYTVLDLFCGCGGLSKGFQDAGFNVAEDVETLIKSVDFGDEDLRNKADNLYQMNPMNMVPLMISPGMDPNQLQQLMATNQLMMGMGINPVYQNPNAAAPQGKNETQTDK